jgi:ABC-type glycerol-3-phosphate transport system substrate-binding protein
LPDVFGILSDPWEYASLIQSGHILALTSYLKTDDGQWEQQFYPQALAWDTFGPANQYGILPGMYGVPIDVTNVQFLYNKDLFKLVGLDPEKPPRTFDEFIAAGAQLKGAGIPGLVSGWGELWQLQCLVDTFAWNVMGRDKFEATIRGEVPYTDPDWIKVFSLFKRCSEAGILSGNMISLTNKGAELMFASQRAAMAFDGSWCVNVYQGMNRDLNYTAFPLPRVSRWHPVAVWGGPGSSFKVNARSPRTEAAVEFLRWLTAKEQQEFLAEATLNLPANRTVAREKIPPGLGQFFEAMDQVVPRDELPYSEYPRVVEALRKGLQLIVIGQKMPAQLARELNQLKTEEIARDPSRRIP